jgi:rsbT co-antagonist protein RsbR
MVSGEKNSMAKHNTAPASIEALQQRVAELEQQLSETQQRETRLRFIVEGSRDGAWDWYMNTNEAYLSSRYREMLGYTEEELPNSIESWTNTIHPDDISYVQEKLEEHLAGKTPVYEIEHRMKRRSGEWGWFLSRGHISERNEQGQPIRMSGTITDITQRKQMEDELRQSAGWFRNLTSSLFDGLAIFEDGYLIENNDKFAAMLGYNADEMLGMWVLDLIAPESKEEVRQNALNGYEEPYEAMMLRKDGSTFPAEILGKMTVYNGQTVRVSTVRDISARKQAEEEQMRLQGEVIDAQRAALRELSTPLMPLTNNVVAMPLVGAIDSARIQQIMETLLEGISHHQSEIAILDITGVQVVDTQVADGLIRAAQAVRLLGAEIVLTGIGSTMAQTLIHLGADMGNITTRGTLQDGIAYAMEKDQRMG